MYGVDIQMQATSSDVAFMSQMESIRYVSMSSLTVTWSMSQSRSHFLDRNAFSLHWPWNTPWWTAQMQLILPDKSHLYNHNKVSRTIVGTERLWTCACNQTGICLVYNTTCATFIFNTNQFTLFPLADVIPGLGQLPTIRLLQIISRAC